MIDKFIAIDALRVQRKKRKTKKPIHTKLSSSNFEFIFSEAVGLMWEMLVNS